MTLHSIESLLVFQNAFIISSKIVYRQDLFLKLVNYQEFKGYLFKEYFCTDIKIYIQ